MSFAVRSLYDRSGKRLYLTPNERSRFLEAAKNHPPKWQTFAKFLLLTGARISEALAVQVDHFDFEDNRVALETLKQRQKGVWRRVPLSVDFMAELNRVHEISKRLGEAQTANHLIWPTSRTTAFERVKEIMRNAGISGPQASPKGLRHTFGIHALLCGVPITSVQSWMGHARITTTQIYLQIGGAEEYRVATLMW